MKRKICNMFAAFLGITYSADVWLKVEGKIVIGGEE